MAEQPLLQMKNIVKNFPGVKALKGVDLEVCAGEVHALMGENGAGKSTLMKCLIGIQPPTSGEIIFDGRKIENYGPYEAMNMGIAMIHQELSPVAHRPIMENVWLGREPVNSLGLVDHARMAQMTTDVLKLIDLDVDPKMRMGELTVAKMQMVEIAKALSCKAKLIIMDEPTSALTEKEVAQLFKIINQLRAEGKGIIYISHKMDEIFQISDRITVFRDGEKVGTDRANDTTMDRMITMMVGRPISEMFPKVDCEIGETYLEVKGLTKGKLFRDISFTVRRGEILGFAGLVGSGRTEVARAVLGIDKVDSGEIVYKDKSFAPRNFRNAVGNGFGLIPEDRKLQGLVLISSVKENISMVNMSAVIRAGVVRSSLEKMHGEDYVKKLNISTPSLDTEAQYLSGGNQQKIVVAKWLLQNSDVIFLDEPTRGIDVGAKAEIYLLINDLVRNGKVVIMISSELGEILGMSDRIIVMHEGRVAGELNAGEATQEAIISLCV